MFGSSSHLISHSDVGRDNRVTEASNTWFTDAPQWHQFVDVAGKNEPNRYPYETRSVVATW